MQKSVYRAALFLALLASASSLHATPGMSARAPGVEAAPDATRSVANDARSSAKTCYRIVITGEG